MRAMYLFTGSFDNHLVPACKEPVKSRYVNQSLANTISLSTGKQRILRHHHLSVSIGCLHHDVGIALLTNTTRLPLTTMAKYDYYPATNQELISDLKLIKHPEGGMYAASDSWLRFRAKSHGAA